MPAELSKQSEDKLDRYISLRKRVPYTDTCVTIFTIVANTEHRSVNEKLKWLIILKRVKI